MSCGITYHSLGDKTVALEGFQDAIVKRHDMELQGHAYLRAEDYAEDFE